MFGLISYKNSNLRIDEYQIKFMPHYQIKYIPYFPSATVCSILFTKYEGQCIFHMSEFNCILNYPNNAICTISLAGKDPTQDNHNSFRIKNKTMEKKIQKYFSKDLKLRKNQLFKINYSEKI